MDIWVFDIKTLEPLNILQTPISAMFGEANSKAATFTVWCAASEVNTKLCKVGNIVWFNNQLWGVISLVSATLDESGYKMKIEGYTSTGLFNRRIIWGLYTTADKNPPAIIYDLVEKNFTSPSDPKRKFPNIVIKDKYTDDSPIIKMQQTGGYVLDTLTSLCDTYSYGIQLLFDPRVKEMEFKVTKGVDRSLNQKTISPVVLSTDYENLLKTNYVRDFYSYRNVALIQGEGQGTNRKTQALGDYEGLERFELYVDARDVSSIASDGSTIPEAEYNQLLIERGKQKLEEFKDAESFDSTTNNFGNFVYGKDYFLGDKITIRDKLLGLRLDAVVTEAEHNYSDTGYEKNVTFGYSQPTLSEKLKMKGVK